MCFFFTRSEDLEVDDVGECTYKIQPPEEANQVIVRAVDPIGQSIWMQDPTDPADRAKGTFKIEGNKPGEYQVCFTNRGTPCVCACCVRVRVLCVYMCVCVLRLGCFMCVFVLFISLCLRRGVRL